MATPGDDILSCNFAKDENFAGEVFNKPALKVYKVGDNHFYVKVPCGFGDSDCMLVRIDDYQPQLQ